MNNPIQREKKKKYLNKIIQGDCWELFRKFWKTDIFGKKV